MSNKDCPLFGRDLFAPKTKAEKERKAKKPRQVEKRYIYVPSKQEQIKVALRGVEPIEGEEWAVIPLAPTYIISSHGRIYNMKRMNSLKPYRHYNRGDLYARVHAPDGRRLMLSIHKLTLELFGVSYWAHRDDDPVVDVNTGYNAPRISNEAPY